MKRCVCGQSSKLPLCDGSHGSQGWACSAEEGQQTPLAMLASPSLVNLADRLAHRFGGVSLRDTDGAVHADRLVVLSDGHHLASVREQSQRVVTGERCLITVGLDPSVAGWAFEGWSTLHIEECEPTLLWRAAEAAIQRAPGPAPTIPPPRVFLSHSVQDEAALFSVVETLRRDFSVPIFVCADSIAPGARWHDEIRGELERCELLLFIASGHANSSTFCAFEAGFATALGKEIHVISLDGQPPPPHLQGIQAVDVERLRARKPWLETSDALLEACLGALQPEAPPKES